MATLLKEKIDDITNEYYYSAKVNVSSDPKHARYIQMKMNNWYYSKYKKNGICLFKLRDVYIHSDSKLLTIDFQEIFWNDGTVLSSFDSLSQRVPRHTYHNLQPYIYDGEGEPSLIDCLLIDTNRLKRKHGK